MHTVAQCSAVQPELNIAELQVRSVLTSFKGNVSVYRSNAPPKAVAEFARVHITCRTNGTENGEDSARKREREKNVMKRNFAFSPACGNPIESPRVTRALSDTCVHISPRKN